jgi:hypothetical protein
VGLGRSPPASLCPRLLLHMRQGVAYISLSIMAPIPWLRHNQLFIVSDAFGSAISELLYLQHGATSLEYHSIYRRQLDGLFPISLLFPFDGFLRKKKRLVGRHGRNEEVPLHIVVQWTSKAAGQQGCSVVSIFLFTVASKASTSAVVVW